MEEYQEVNEIDLIDLLFYCLKRWRWIVVCMVLSGVLVGAYKYQATIEENQMKKVEQIRQTTTESVEGETQVESEPITFDDPVSSAVAFAAIGMIGVAALICLKFSVSYGKLQNENNFQQKFDMPLLGVVRKKKSEKVLFEFVDQWICRLEEGPCAKVSRIEQIKITTVNVQNAIQRNSKEKIQRIMLAGTIVNNDVIEICDKLTEEICDVTFSSYGQIVFQASALRELEDYEGIVFIEKKGDSYEKLIRQEKKLAADRCVKIIGTIIC